MTSGLATVLCFSVVVDRADVFVGSMFNVALPIFVPPPTPLPLTSNNSTLTDPVEIDDATYTGRVVLEYGSRLAHNCVAIVVSVVGLSPCTNDARTFVAGMRSTRYQRLVALPFAMVIGNDRWIVPSSLNVVGTLKTTLEFTSVCIRS